MNPVLIYTDQERINAEIAVVDNAAPLFQQIYTALKNVGVTATLADINSFVFWTINGNGMGDFVATYTLEKLTDKLAPYQYNGVTMSRDWFKNNIDVPDTSAITDLLSEFRRFLGGNIKGINPAYLSLVDDVITKADTADDAITTAYTYYTKTDASAQLATELQAVCDAMNTFDENHNDAFKHSLGLYTSYGLMTKAETPIAGIALLNDEFVVSLAYIRNQEELAAN